MKDGTKALISAVLAAILFGFCLSWWLNDIYRPTLPTTLYIVEDGSSPFGLYYSDDVEFSLGDPTILHGYYHWGKWNEGDKSIPAGHFVTITRTYKQENK